MKVFDNLPIARKLALAFAGVFMIGVAASGIGLTQLATIQESSQATERTLATRGHIDELLDAFVAQQSAMRGLLLSGAPAYVDDYRAAVDSYAGAYDRARAGLSARPARLDELEAINQEVADWQTRVAARQIELMREPLTTDEARALEVSGVSVEAMARVRGLYDELVAAQQTLLERRAAAERAAFSTAYLVLILGGLLSLAAAVGFGLLLLRSLSRPISAMTGVMARLAEGDTAVEVPSVGRGDEVGAMASAVQVFKDNALRNAEMAEAARREEAQRAARATRLGELTEGFSRDVGTILEQVTGAARQVAGTSEGLSGTAQDTTGRATAVASASEQASHNVETVASASEELGASIEEISRQVMTQRELASEAASDAKSSDEEVRRLAESAQKIGDVVRLITDIAEQTNLLALNATIEAARAGDAGKGFAVVAGEVKSLGGATQTARATEQIAKDVEAIQAQTSNTVQAIEVISGRIGSISEIATAVASAVEEQSAATKEISRNVQEAAAGARDVTSNIAGVTEMAGAVDRSSNELAEASQSLTSQAEELESFVTRFIADVRAA